jgi:hypothetical protein
MIFGPLFLILVFAMVIAVAVLIVRSLAGPWQGAGPQAAPRLTSSKSGLHGARSTRTSLSNAAACSGSEPV